MAFNIAQRIICLLMIPAVCCNFTITEVMTTTEGYDTVLKLSEKFEPVKGTLGMTEEWPITDEDEAAVMETEEEPGSSWEIDGTTPEDEFSTTPETPTIYNSSINSFYLNIDIEKLNTTILKPRLSDIGPSYDITEESKPYISSLTAFEGFAVIQPYIQPSLPDPKIIDLPIETEEVPFVQTLVKCWVYRICKNL